MSFDRIDSNSAGYGRQGPPRPATSPSFSGNSTPESKAGNIPEWGIPLAGAASDSFAKEWAQSSLTYGSHSFAAEAINRAASPNSFLRQKVRPTAANLSKDTTNPMSTAIGNAAEAGQRAVSYSELLHLGNEQTPVNKLSWNRLSDNVQSNLKNFKEWIKPNNIKDFFAHTSTSGYLKNTVYRGNIQPIKDMGTAAKRTDGDVGTGVFKTLGMSLLGFDVVRHGYDAYKNAKSQEDGSLKSKWHTAAATVKETGKYAARDGTSWEFAGIGAAIGKAILPVAIGGVSLGGIAAGALLGLLAEKGMDKLLHTGDKDPNNKKGDDDPVEDGSDTGAIGIRR